MWLKVLEVPLAEANRLARLVPRPSPGRQWEVAESKFQNCLKYDKAFSAEQQNPDEKIRGDNEIRRTARGNVRNTGVHACGVIICRDDITDWVPVSMATDADGEKVLTTQYEGEHNRGHRSDQDGLPRPEDAVNNQGNHLQNQASTWNRPDIENIPLDDKATFDLYCKGNTTSTFQFESPACRIRFAVCNRANSKT